jgi:hypothetical protein
MGNDVAGQGGVEHAGGVKLLAGDGRANNREDARADDGANTERGERPRAQCLLERVLRFARVADQLINGLAGKQLAGQGSSPHPSGCGARSVAGVAGIGVDSD